jgi:septum formation inhibitor MinC
MSRKTSFTEAQIKEMKQVIRTGEPIVMLAERLASQYNVTENTLRNKLYSVAKRTKKIADWAGPKKRVTKTENTSTPDVDTMIVDAPTTTEATAEVVGKRVVMYDDHIRIYF